MNILSIDWTQIPVLHRLCSFSKSVCAVHTFCDSKDILIINVFRFWVVYSYNSFVIHCIYNCLVLATMQELITWVCVTFTSFVLDCILQRLRVWNCCLFPYAGNIEGIPFLVILIKREVNCWGHHNFAWNNWKMLFFIY